MKRITLSVASLALLAILACGPTQAAGTESCSAELRAKLRSVGQSWYCAQPKHLTLRQAATNVRRQLSGGAIPLAVCYGSCWITEDGELVSGSEGEYVPAKVNQARIRVVGRGIPRVLNGVRRWKAFRVTGCGWVYSRDTAVTFAFTYYGGTHIGDHFLSDGDVYAKKSRGC